MSTSPTIRAPAVAGAFYPADPAELRATLDRLLSGAGISGSVADAPKALIVPHAGYTYSGPVAAAAYRSVQSSRRNITRVVLLGPSHRVYLRGIAVPQAEAFATPLGDIAIDTHLRRQLLRRGDVIESNTPHEFEHCLEVQLPFLQSVLREFTLLPLVVGEAKPDYVASVLADVWGGPETLILLSSDLSHYHPYQAASDLDDGTASAIVNRQSDLTHEQACGASGINGLTLLAKQRNFSMAQIARNNSGDTAGDRKRVVGYGAFALYESPSAS